MVTPPLIHGLISSGAGSTDRSSHIPVELITASSSAARRTYSECHLIRQPGESLKQEPGNHLRKVLREYQRDRAGGLRARTILQKESSPFCLPQRFWRLVSSSIWT